MTSQNTKMEHQREAQETSFEYEKSARSIPPRTLPFSFMYLSQSSESSFSSFFPPPFASGRHAAGAASGTAAAAAALSRALLPQLLVASSRDTTLPLPETLLCRSSTPTPTYVTQLAADLSASELSRSTTDTDIRSGPRRAPARRPLLLLLLDRGAPQPALALGAPPPAPLPIGGGVGEGARGEVVVGVVGRGEAALPQELEGELAGGGSEWHTRQRATCDGDEGGALPANPRRRWTSPPRRGEEAEAEAGRRGATDAEAKNIFSFFFFSSSDSRLFVRLIRFVA